MTTTPSRRGRAEPMQLFPEADATASDFVTFAELEREMGFVPNLFRAQTLLPRVIEAEVQIAATVLFNERALSRLEKESMALALAAACGNRYCVCAHAHELDRLGAGRGGGESRQAALTRFALKLGRNGGEVSPDDFVELRRCVPEDAAILEAILVTALAGFLCTLSTGVGAAPDFPESAHAVPLAGPGGWASSGTSVLFPGSRAGDLRTAELDPDEFPPFAFFQRRFGFVPNIFRAQTLRPDVIEAEARAIEKVLLTEDVLDRVTKEFILLVVSSANLNTYCVAVHCEMLRRLGVPAERADQVALDHHRAGLDAPTVALLDFALRLARTPGDYGPADLGLLRAEGFDDRQILEAVVMTSLTVFLNTLQLGLAPVADFEPRLFFGPGGPERRTDVNLLPAPARPTVEESEVDAGLLARARRGEPAAFDALIRRHTGRLYRTLLALGGNEADAEDDLQNAFVKAWQKLETFRGDSLFSTWLTRIAINEGTQRLRRVRPTDSMDLDREEDRVDRPRRLEAWQDDPEALYSREELRRLVEKAVLGLPVRYRIVLVLRDLEGLSGEEASRALDLKLATLKTRLLRGRMLLREALAPHFERRSRRRHV